MRITENLSSGYLILLFLLFTAGLYTLLYLLRISIPLVYSRRIKTSNFRRYFTIVEVISWGLFLLMSAYYFLKHNIIFSALIFLILLLILFWYSHFALRDYIAGVVFKSENRFSVGDTIEVKEYKGEIKKFNYRNIEVENENGKRVLLPYSMLLGIIGSPQKISETVLNFSFEIDIPSVQPYDKVTRLLKKHIYSLPWTALKYEPKIQLLQEINHNYKLKITIYSFDETYFHPIHKQVEAYVMDNFQSPEL